MADDLTKARLKEDDWKEYGDKAPEASSTPTAPVVAEASPARPAQTTATVIAPVPVGDYSL